jgi:hypothetical protein
VTQVVCEAMAVERSEVDDPAHDEMDIPDVKVTKSTAADISLLHRNHVSSVTVVSLFPMQL